MLSRMTRAPGYYYEAATGRAVDESLGKLAFKEFFNIERRIARLFRERGGKEGGEDLQTRMGREIEDCLAGFQGDKEERRTLEDILWSMTNYLRSYMGSQRLKF